LAEILRRNATTKIGERHGFGAVTDVASFRRQVPLCGYDDLLPDLLAIRAGELRVLTAERVTHLVPTSGSSGAVKLLPYTPALARAFQAAIAPWICDLLRRHPGIAQGPAYWSVSPAFALPDTASAVPVGFAGDARYLGGWLEAWVGRILVAPDALRHSMSMAGFQYATLLLLLATAELRLISVWHPSFFSLLWSARGEHWERLLDDLAHGTLQPPAPLGAVVEAALRRRLAPQPARALRLRQLGPTLEMRAAWPQLAVVSAWSDALAQAPSLDLRQRIAPVAFEPKGLFATEAFVSVPYAGQRPLAVCSHYFEFLSESGSCLESHELAVGARYEVVVTTQGGLYRYRLGDLVEVDGHLGATPSLRFVGRVDSTVDQVGEKLTDAFVAGALALALAEQPATAFAMLAPDARPAASPDRQTHRPGYTLFVDTSVRRPLRVAEQLTASLRANPHFAYALDLGQLPPLRVFVVAGDAQAAYLASESRRQPLGGIKPRALSQRADWSRQLPGTYVVAADPSSCEGATP
jgi:GH3 auxin-responsive promoter